MAWSRDEIARRIASDIPDGWTVNIGVGIPTLVPRYIPQGREVVFHSENGILGMVPLREDESPDPEVIDAGKNAVSIRFGGSFFDSSVSFAMIRGGHIDLGIVGALQVSQNGDLSNWSTNERMIGGIGGAADVCSGVKQLWVAMMHTAENGTRKLLTDCTFPLTAVSVVCRVYSDLAVLERDERKWKVVTLSPGTDLLEVRNATGFPIDI